MIGSQGMAGGGEQAQLGEGEGCRFGGFIATKQSQPPTWVPFCYEGFWATGGNWCCLRLLALAFGEHHPHVNAVQGTSYPLSSRDAGTCEQCLNIIMKLG